MEIIVNFKWGRFLKSLFVFFGASIGVASLQATPSHGLGGNVPNSMIIPKAFQANTGVLWLKKTGNYSNSNLAMMPGTNPSGTLLQNGKFVVAFQAPNGNLHTITDGVVQDWAVGMMAGTSPSITPTFNGSYQIAFQANTQRLWVVGSNAVGNTNLMMMRGTSPSITTRGTTLSSATIVAFQSENGTLATRDSTGNLINWPVGMRKGTSPSITVTDAGIQIAFQANTSNLWIVGDNGAGDTQMKMMAGTSPSIATLRNGATVTAFQSFSGNLYTFGHGGTRQWSAGMMAGTSPSITPITVFGTVTADSGMPKDLYQISFQANTGNLWALGAGTPTGPAGIGNQGVGMAPGTSPTSVPISIWFVQQTPATHPVFGPFPVFSWSF